MPEVNATKDSSNQYPVPDAWRKGFKEIVRSFASGDYELKQGIAFVNPVAAKVAIQAKAYVENFGETLVDLPEAAWETSVSQWMDGYWDVLIDLWTAEAGASDLVLSARVIENDDYFQIEVRGLYVP